MAITCDAPTAHYETGCKLLLCYDTDSDGNISTTELLAATEDFNNGIITQEEMDFLSDCWALPSPNINNKCLGCYAPGVTITFVTKKEDGSDFNCVSVYVNEAYKGVTPLPVDLIPGELVTVKLVMGGYITQEFSYTVPATPETVTKTMVLVPVVVITCDSNPFASIGLDTGCKLLLHYDADNDGLINLDELTQSYADYENGIITEAEFDFVSDAYIYDGINVVCPGCWEAPPCTCTAWVNGECTAPGKRRQTRTCTPAGCDIEERIIDDPTCPLVVETIPINCGQTLSGGSPTTSTLTYYKFTIDETQDVSITVDITEDPGYGTFKVCVDWEGNDPESANWCTGDRCLVAKMYSYVITCERKSLPAGTYYLYVDTEGTPLVFNISLSCLYVTKTVSFESVPAGATVTVV